MSIIHILAWLILIAVAGCSSTIPSAAPILTVSSPATPVQLELEQMAAAFEGLVGAHGEPKLNQTVGAYMAQFSREELSRLGWASHFQPNGVLMLSDGSVVTVGIEFGSCMLFEGGSITSMDYEFVAAGHNERAKISIVFTFGDPNAEG